MDIIDFLWIIAFGLLAALVLNYSLSRYGHWFTPVSVFVGINAASISVYHLRLLDMNDVSLHTHLIVLSSMFVFIWGAHAAGRLRVGEGDPWSLGTIDDSHLDSFFTTTALLATFGWGLAAMILVARHGLPAIIANPWVLQLEFQMQFIGYLNVLGILVPPTYVLLQRRDGFRLLPFLLMLSAVWGLLLAGIKAYLVYSGLTALFCWSVAAPKRFRPRYFLAGLGVLLVFFVSYNRVIDVFVNEIYTSDTFFGRLTALHRPYIYFTGPWPAMDSLVHGHVEPAKQFASIVLDPIWKILGDGLGWIDPVPLTLPFTDIGTSLFNVYTFFGEVYRDLGWLGLLALSWALGFVGTRLYLRARRAGYWGNALVYGLVGHGIFLSCFMYTFRFFMGTLLVFVYLFGFVILRGGVLVDRRRRETGAR
jgi:oligosaccharide repeat unit polymerase